MPEASTAFLSVLNITMFSNPQHSLLASREIMVSVEVSWQRFISAYLLGPLSNIFQPQMILQALHLSPSWNPISVGFSFQMLNSSQLENYYTDANLGAWYDLYQR